eukprot:scaffold6672_cov286-Pinguiococcus_pyrenoidosus.AAC.4
MLAFPLLPRFSLPSSPPSCAPPAHRIWSASPGGLSCLRCGALCSCHHVRCVKVWGDVLTVQQRPIRGPIPYQYFDGVVPCAVDGSCGKDRDPVARIVMVCLRSGTKAGVGATGWALRWVDMVGSIDVPSDRAPLWVAAVEEFVPDLNDVWIVAGKIGAVVVEFWRGIPCYAITPSELSDRKQSHASTGYRARADHEPMILSKMQPALGKSHTGVEPTLISSLRVPTASPAGHS